MPLSATLALASIAYLIFSITSSTVSPLSQTHSSFFGDTALVAPRSNIWAELSQQEATELYDFLYQGQSDLNLTRHPIGEGVENGVHSIEVLRPNKTDALPYLDSSGEEPLRWAHLIATEHGLNGTRLAQYMVGPLPVCETTKVLPLQYCFNSGRNSVESPIDRDSALLSFVIELLDNMPDVLDHLLGAKLNLFDPFDPNGIRAALRITADVGSRSIGWLTAFGTGPRSGEWSLQPHGLYAKVEISRNANGTQEYQVLLWAYNGEFYESVDELRIAMKSPDFVVLPKMVDGPWADTEDFDANPRGRSLPPPVMVQPHGPRYQIDHDQNYISWMGFTFYLATSNANAVALFDVAFQGSRILYSLELQEALSHYAGSDPAHGGMWFFDSFFGMGLNQVELVPGYDCPVYATYLNTSYHLDDQTLTAQNSVCIFEYTADHPISRHTAPYSTSVSRNTYLVVRAVSTVGNYDYQIDYAFYLDGTIEVKYRASGYIIASFYPPWLDHHHTQSNTTATTTGPQTPHPDSDTDSYGFHIQDTISSSMHTHILNYRADFDIASTTQNTFQTLSITPQTRQYTWDLPEIPNRQTMSLVPSNLTHETALNWPANAQKIYLLTALSTANSTKYHNPRAYRIMPGAMPGAPAHLAIENSTALRRAAPWATADLFVTRHHDAEPFSSSPLSYLSPHDPLVDFAAFLADNESVVEEDLVVYFNLGNHHVPNSGDVPNTLEHVSGSAVMFVPFNFGARDESRAGVSGVRIDERRGAKGGKAGRDDDDDAAGEEDGRAGDLRSRSRSRSRGAGAAAGSEKEEGEGGGREYSIRHFGGHYGAAEHAGGQRLEADLHSWGGGGKIGPWDAVEEDGDGRGQTRTETEMGRREKDNEQGQRARQERERSYKAVFVENMNAWMLG